MLVVSLSKSVKLPFSSSENQSTEPLNKVHCDLWGPAAVTSLQRFKYYAVFADDFPRYSWIYPLQRKSDFMNIFVTFQKLVEK